jgi:hypothetical protein
MKVGTYSQWELCAWAACWRGSVMKEEGQLGGYMSLGVVMSNKCQDA